MAMPKSAQTRVEMITNTTGIPTSHTHTLQLHEDIVKCACVCDVGMPVVFVIISTTYGGGINNSLTSLKTEISSLASILNLRLPTTAMLWPLFPGIYIQWPFPFVVTHTHLLLAQI